jgi:lipoprotein-releasing system permease protein
MYRWFLALRWLLTRPINLLGVVGVTLGVWALIVVVSIFSGFLRVVAEHIREASADVSVLYLPDDAQYAPLARALEADDGVAATAPRLVHFGLLHRPGQRPPPSPLLGRSALQGGDTPFLFVLGVDPAREAATTGFRSWLAAVAPERAVRDADRPLDPLGGRPSILIGEERMRSEGLRPGDELVLTTGRIERAAGGGRGLDPVSRTFVVAGAFRTAHAPYDGNNAFVHIDELRRLLDLRVPDAVQEIAVRVRDRAATEATSARLQRAVRGALGLDQLSPGRGPVAWSWHYRHKRFLQGVEWQRSLMKIVLVVIMVVAAVLMYATLSMMVTEKTGDIGILTAMGATPRGVMTLFLGSGLTITAVGIVAGTLAGCVSAVYLEEFRRFVLAVAGVDLFPVKVYNLDRVPHELDPWWMLQVAGMATAVGTVVSLVPAWRAARHDPLVSLRGV